ncbi:MAG TPA: DUF1722 domain-containing protein [Methanoculleus sp.]|nr:DUF1722 domain-containing protein [Methanoculleus sp.]
MVKTRTFISPHILVSRCIEFDHCRYNGDMITSHIVRKLKGDAEFIHVCPENDIGLGVPRDPVRIVRVEGENRLIQPATGRDVTEEMHRFSEAFLHSLPPIDGVILKTRSPSCGIKDVNVYPRPGRSAAIDKSAGFFAGAVQERFPLHPIEDEGRLRNVRIRDHFLTCIFTLSDFDRVETSGRPERLVRFHTRNKFLLMACNQRLQREMGTIIAHGGDQPFASAAAQYRERLLAALARAPPYTANINVLLHALGHVSGHLSRDEKALFLDSLEQYRQGYISICAPKNILKSWIVRFDDPYLGEQTFFAPFPDHLMEISEAETDRGRDFWG